MSGVQGGMASLPERNHETLSHKPFDHVSSRLSDCDDTYSLEDRTNESSFEYSNLQKNTSVFIEEMNKKLFYLNNDKLLEDVCDDVQKATIDSEYFQEHGQYKCKKCDFQTSDAYNVRRHVRGVHLGIKLKCQKCDYMAARKETLRKHIS